MPIKRLGVSWRPPGNLESRRKADLGCSEALWTMPSHSGGSWEASWALLGRCGGSPKRPLGLLGPSWRHPRLSWVPFWPSWTQWKRKRRARQKHQFPRRKSAIFAYMGLYWGVSWGVFGASS
eukprot:5822517-Pyramimonas_sp.AAC.1